MEHLEIKVALRSILLHHGAIALQSVRGTSHGRLHHDFRLSVLLLGFNNGRSNLDKARIHLFGGGHLLRGGLRSIHKLAHIVARIAMVRIDAVAAIGRRRVVRHSQRRLAHLATDRVTGVLARRVRHRVVDKSGIPAKKKMTRKKRAVGMILFFFG
ncbi:hypothetical protein BC940DRAFT_286781 [Gongronella butleri]|nr:hypothetical protein BC940DRAFT_286781 [Gongronella butleri]